MYDIVLAAVGGHELARVSATDAVTSPLRAPFVHESVREDGHVVEEPRAKGARRAVGELLTCPSSPGQWTCATFVTGMVLTPRPAAPPPRAR